MEALQIQYHRFGHPRDVLIAGSTKVEPPAAGQVLVRMLASPINPSDLIPVGGAYAHRISLPAVPGYEGVGTVVAAGPSVSEGMIGRRVLPLRGEGTWQEYVAAPAELAVPVPDFIDDGAAAQLYINPLTAWLACTESLRLKPGDTLLVNACGSAIGRLFAQLSRILGFRLIAVVRNGAYSAELTELGACRVIDTSNTDLRRAVSELTHGRGAEAAVDSVGGPEATGLALCVRPGGTLLSIGLLSGIAVDAAEIARRANVRMKLFHLRHWNERVSARTWQTTFAQLIGLIADGRLSLMPPAARYPLRRVREAVAAAQAGGANRGKVLLTGELGGPN